MLFPARPTSTVVPAVGFFLSFTGDAGGVTPLVDDPTTPVPALRIFAAPPYYSQPVSSGQRSQWARVAPRHWHSLDFARTRAREEEHVVISFSSVSASSSLPFASTPSSALSSSSESCAMCFVVFLGCPGVAIARALAVASRTCRLGATGESTVGGGGVTVRAPATPAASSCM